MELFLLHFGGSVYGLVFWVFGWFQKRASDITKYVILRIFLGNKLACGLIGPEFFADRYIAGVGLDHFGCFWLGRLLVVGLFSGVGRRGGFFLGVVKGVLRKLFLVILGGSLSSHNIIS